MYIKKLKIGNVELENNLILAPMAGITNLPFRIICKKLQRVIHFKKEAGNQSCLKNQTIKTMKEQIFQPLKQYLISMYMQSESYIPVPVSCHQS